MQGMIGEAWGKTDRESCGVHPLAHHSMDVAAVFARMMELPIIRNRLETAADARLTDVNCQRLSAMAFLHDIGKLHPGHCQSKVAGLSYSTEDRELGRLELTPLGECSGAVELEIVP